MDTLSIEYALLSTQKALLDVITPELRAVVVDFNNREQLLYLRFYYHGEVSEELIDIWQCVITEVDLGPDCKLDDGIERLDYPIPIPLRGRYAYLRKENFSPSICKAQSVSMEIVPIAQGLLAVQSTLLGVVTPELRAVIVDFLQEEQLLYIRFYYDGEISEELIKLWQCAIIETSFGLGIEHKLDGKVERCDYPQIIPFQGRYAYARKE